jgi:hypothetical protein
MAISMKRVTLWRREVPNKPGMLAATLEPLATGGTDLQVVMAYRYPGNPSQAAIEVFPVSGRKATSAAQSGGLTASTIPTVLVTGDNRAGLGHAISDALAREGINVDFHLAQVIGKRVSAVFGFETDADARKAMTVIKTAARRAATKGAKGK